MSASGDRQRKEQDSDPGCAGKNLTVLSIRMGRFGDLLSACHLKGPEQFVPMPCALVTS